MISQHILGPVYMIDAPYHGEQGALGTYVVKGSEAMVIDPGPAPQSPGVLAGLKELSVTDPRYIALTHVHLDHGGGAWMMADAFPEAEVLVHPKGVEHVVDPTKLADAAKAFHGERFKLYGEVKGISPMRVTESKEETMDLGGATLKVIYTPGHATHCQSFYEPDSKILIAGDSCGLYSKRTNNVFPASPPPFNPAKAVESLDKLIALRPDILCFSHFGYVYDAVKRMTLFREQLSLWDKVITQAVRERLDLNQTYDRLLESDPLLRLAQQGSDGRTRAAFPNIIGFSEYAKWLIKNETKTS